MAINKDKTACPRCGKLVVPKNLYGDAFPHHCHSVGSKVPKFDGSFFKSESGVHSIEEAPRLTACNHCGRGLDVSLFDPLETVHCSLCNADFVLHPSFAGCTLIRACDAGWYHAVYIGRHNKTKELVIIKVLSAHVLSQPDARTLFKKECAEIRSQFQDGYSSEMEIGEYAGFDYCLIPLGSEFPDDALENDRVLQVAGTPKISTPEPAVDTVPERIIECAKCKKRLDLSRCNPLDQIICPGCQDAFELFRTFGDYRLDYRLTTGGTSLLYLAHHQVLNKDVAMKILSAEETIHGEECIRQFVKECEVTRKLVHPNIVQAYDHGEQNGFYYLAMELVEGLTLDDVLKAEQDGSANKGEGFVFEGSRERYKDALPELVALEIIIQAAAGLGFAHQQGFVHGDVKPSNIMVTFEGVVKVLDFGLFQMANAEKIFKEGEEVSIQGTPLYVPPERVRGEPEDFRSDIYGLGATLYHLLRGVPPFIGKTAEEVVIKQVKAPNMTFKTFAPWVTDTTCRVVEKSLKKLIEDRYGSHMEFIADLTLAKNQALQSLRMKPTDGKMILKSYMRTLPMRASSRAWKRAETNAVRTYRYVTKAISQMTPKITFQRRSLIR